MADSITVNGVEYVPASSKPSGNRAIVVVDKGWIFAGDMTRKDGRILLENALHVFKWEALGFAGMVDDPKKAKADLRKVADVDIPAGAEIFCVPVPSNWGL